jgi:tetratricopeptide (TPR) repeat protein
VLLRLGERESGTEHLNQAVTAYRAALEENTRDRVPLEWAMTQMDLGAALETLGVRESGTEHLNQAVTAYRAALEENARDRVPLQWAYAQHGMANALATLAKRENSAARLREAIMCMQGAAEEYGKAGETYWLPTARRRVAEMNDELSQMRVNTARERSPN